MGVSRNIVAFRMVLGMGRYANFYFYQDLWQGSLFNAQARDTDAMDERKEKEKDQESV